MIRFLDAEGINGNAIYQRHKTVYSIHFIARRTVSDWMLKFQSGITCVKDAPCPDQARCVVAPETAARAEELVKKIR